MIGAEINGVQSLYLFQTTKKRISRYSPNESFILFNVAVVTLIRVALMLLFDFVSACRTNLRRQVLEKLYDTFNHI